MSLTVSLIALVLVSAALNVVLAHEVSRSRTRPSRGLAPGTSLPSLAGTTPDGLELTIHFGQDPRPTVVYYFSPACGWCERNWPNVRALAGATADRFRWVGVSAATTEDLAAFADARTLDFEIITGLSPSLLRDYQLTGTPNTLVIGADGRLVKSWIGAFQTPHSEEVERFFQTPLPGLGPESARRDDLRYGDSRD